MKNKKDLIAQISQNLGEPAAAAQKATTQTKVAAPRSATKPVPNGDGARPRPRKEVEITEAPRSTGSGKQAAFWLDDEDRAIFHETGMLLYSQGIKPSHNLVLRAAIRMIPRDHRLVEKVRELIEKDGRKVRHQKK